jgi:hypothetical protein
MTRENPMSTARIPHRVAATALAGLALMGFASPALADTAGPSATLPVVADTAAPGEVIAATASTPSAGTSATAGIRALASRPRAIVVTGHGGRPVALVREGSEPLRIPRPGGAPATFTGLAPGATYTVVVGGLRVARVTAVDRPSPVTRIVVHRTPAVGTVQVRWEYRTTRSAGRVGFEVTASAAGAPTVRALVADVRSATLTGLQPATLYTFSVTPTNTAGRGRSTSAVMTQVLGAPAVTPLPTAPVAPPAPAPVPAPAPAPAPATRTILVCPAGFTENTSGTCTSRLPYTFHDEATGPAPLLTSVETTIRACPAGASLEDYGWTMYCRTYGPVPTRSVKDATPAGYTDTGSAWERTVAKEAVEVPA